MKRVQVFLSALVLGIFVLISNISNAADVSNTLTAGEWSQTTNLVGDVYQVTKLTRLTNSVSTSDILEVPSNAIGDIRLSLFGGTLNDNGVSNTVYLYPTPTSFKLSGSTTSYTDAVSVTTSLADLTSSAVSTSMTIPLEYAGFKLTGGSSISTSEVIDVRVNYMTPKACRWPKC